MIYSKHQLSQIITQHCKANNIKHIVISPGSRNAPLVIGFTEDPFFKCYSVVDERCAAFFALGIAQQLQTPTVLVCTSGSALLNYYPAISEAFYSDIPLVVLSADRPKHLINIGDGQTIIQKDVFKNHILYAANLKQEFSDYKDVQKSDDVPLLKSIKNTAERFLDIQSNINDYNSNEVYRAIRYAKTHHGPVHVNAPFEEPLYETTSQPFLLPEIDSITSNHETSHNLKHCLEVWNSSIKKLILVGVCSPNKIEKKWLEHLAKDPSVIVLTETTSNIHHNDFFSGIDQLISGFSHEEKMLFQPDILITFGGLVVSKKIKLLLRKYKPNKHWHIDPKKANDTFFCLTQHIPLEPNVFFSKIVPESTVLSSTYHSIFKGIKEKRLKKHDTYLENSPFSDFKVFHKVLKTIPEHYTLQVSNSSAIRYTQLFKLNETVRVYCNRGTSGIDGSTSTSIGCAVVTKTPTLLITGDLSFFYDSNALWNNYIPKHFRIILINNSGGGIFRILPGNKNTSNFETYFETKHRLTAENLCQMYHFTYQKAHNIKTIESALTSFYKLEEQPKLLEIFTPREINDKVLLEYFNFIA